jgi:flavodoxin
MKSLVAYDSNFSNTQKIAEIIAEELGVKAVKISHLNPKDLNGYNFLIIGTPIIGWKPTVKMQVFLQNLPNLKGIKATTFDTRVKLFIHGDAMNQVANSLKNFGAEIFTKPVSFYVAGPQQTPYLLDGEIEKAKNWAKTIQKM